MKPIFFVEVWNSDMTNQITVQMFPNLDMAYAFVARMLDIVAEYDLKYFVSDDLEASERIYTSNV